MSTLHLNVAWVIAACNMELRRIFEWALDGPELNFPVAFHSLFKPSVELDSGLAVEGHEQGGHDVKSLRWSYRVFKCGLVVSSATNGRVCTHNTYLYNIRKCNLAIGTASQTLQAPRLPFARIKTLRTWSVSYSCELCRLYTCYL